MPNFKFNKIFFNFVGKIGFEPTSPSPRRGRFKPISVLPVILHTFQFFFLLASNIICKNSAITTNMPFVTFTTFISNHFMYHIFFVFKKRAIFNASYSESKGFFFYKFTVNYFIMASFVPFFHHLTSFK